jgi:hypothetical protein
MSFYVQVLPIHERLQANECTTLDLSRILAPHHRAPPNASFSCYWLSAAEIESLLWRIPLKKSWVEEAKVH